jgi:hypothetical protein
MRIRLPLLTAALLMFDTLQCLQTPESASLLLLDTGIAGIFARKRLAHGSPFSMATR